MKSRILLGALLGVLVMGTACTKSSKERVVVVYVSEDRVFSEPVLRLFEKRTGIRVRAVYDTEEAKGTGVMNRLILEKDSPRADVYWANEPIRAEVLKQKGIAEKYVSPSARDIPAKFRDPEGYWTGFSARYRVFLVSTDASEVPSAVADYADPRFRGRGAIANPLFGTTAIHVAVLFTRWGDTRARAFMDRLKANGTLVTSSNGESADFVARGRASFALVDSDDAVSRIRRGAKVRIVYPDQKGAGVLVLPNAVLLVRGAPHPTEGKRLIDFLLSREVEEMLATADCAQIPLHPGVKPPKDLRPPTELKTMDIDYGAVARKMVQIQNFLSKWAK